MANRARAAVESAFRRDWRRVAISDDRYRFWRPGPRELSYQFDLNETVYGDVTVFYPHLMVAHHAMSELLKELESVASPLDMPCYGQSLRDLMPRTWDIDRWDNDLDAPDPAPVQRLVADIESVGSEFFRRFTSLEDLVALLETDRTALRQPSLAIGQALLGNMDGSIAALARYVVDGPRHYPPDSIHVTRFVRRFMDRFGIADADVPFVVTGR